MQSVVQIKTEKKKTLLALNVQIKNILKQPDDTQCDCYSILTTVSKSGI